MQHNGAPVSKLPVLRCWALRIGFTVALAGWMVLIFYLSSLTAEQSSRVGPFDAYAISWIGGLRSILAHLLLFGMLASFIQATMWSWTTFTDHSLRLAIGAVILAALYGISDEFHQSFVVGRTMTATDMAVDALGALVTVATLRQAVIWALRSPILASEPTPSKV